MRQALVSKNVYLPNHRKNYTSIYYMKKILSGTIKYLTYDMLKQVEVPLYSEFEPSNVIDTMNLENDFPTLWKSL